MGRPGARERRAFFCHRGVGGDRHLNGAPRQSICSDNVRRSGACPQSSTKITEQVKAGAFPVRLGSDDWVSGNTVWLLDVIAADRQQATSVLANFRQLAGERSVKIHPIVGRLIDPDVLAKLVAAHAEAAAKVSAEKS